MPKFPKRNRILKGGVFDLLLKRGLKRGSGPFSLRWQRARQKRLGIAVSREIRKAVQRNRIKRLIREHFRLYPEQFPPGDVIVIARRGLDNLNNNAIREALFCLLGGEK